MLNLNVDATVESLTEVLKAAAEAHHAYEQETGKPDAEWATWYAEWIIARYAVDTNREQHKENVGKFLVVDLDGNQHIAETTDEAESLTKSLGVGEYFEIVDVVTENGEAVFLTTSPIKVEDQNAHWLGEEMETDIGRGETADEATEELYRAAKVVDTDLAIQASLGRIDPEAKRQLETAVAKFEAANK